MSDERKPFNLPAEEALIGACFLSPGAVIVAADMVQPDDMYSPVNSAIYHAVLAVAKSGLTADVVTVSNYLDSLKQLDGIGGSGFLMSLQANTPSSADASVFGYAKVIRNHALLRKAISFGEQLSANASSIPSDVQTFMADVQRDVSQLSDGAFTDSGIGFDDALEDGFFRLDERFQSDGSITGLETGLVAFDEILSGLQPGTLNILGARPAMGKSAVALEIAAFAAIVKRIPVAFFSLEMGHGELMQRMLANRARIDSKRLKTGEMWEDDWEKLAAVIPEVMGAPLIIEDNPGIDINGIRAEARRIKNRMGSLGLVVVDYLQLMQGRRGAESRQIEVSEISRSLKLLARELDCPILALTQLNRGLEQRPNKRPMLSDIRESGSLEQDADVVVFLYRDEMYNEESPAKGICEVIVAKHRSGDTGTLRFAYVGAWTKFLNIASTGE